MIFPDGQGLCVYKLGRFLPEGVASSLYRALTSTQIVVGLASAPSFGCENSSGIRPNKHELSKDILSPPHVLSPDTLHAPRPPPKQY